MSATIYTMQQKIIQHEEKQVNMTQSQDKNLSMDTNLSFSNYSKIQKDNFQALFTRRQYYPNSNAR